MLIGLDFGVLLYEFGPAAVVRIAKHAEECGFGLIACGDHLVLPDVMPLRDTAHLDKPVITVSESTVTAKRIFRQGAPMPDPFLWFTHMAAVTKRIAFATAIYVLPVRHPLVVARSAATFDFLSEGRLFLGVGAGWIPGEFEIAGQDFKSRGRRMNESIRVMRELWEKETPQFQGEFYSFPPARFEPKPVQKGGIPIMIGGETPVALRRAATLGDGWCGRIHTPQSLREHLGRINKMRQEAGRADSRFIVQCRISPTATADEMHALHEAGAQQMITAFREAKDEDGFMREIDRIASTLLARK